MYEVQSEYPRAKVVGFTDDGQLKISTLSRVVYERLFTVVRRAATPGVPLCRVAASNGALLDKQAYDVANAIVQRVKLLSSTSPDELAKLTPIELIQRGFCDPIKLFVKNEPHPVESKIKTGRVRLISAVSLLDSHVERSFSTNQNDAEKLNWLTCPTACGIGFTDAQNRAVFAHIDAKGPRAESDISGWDWSVQDYEIVVEALRRVRAAEVDADSPLGRLILNRQWCLANSVFALPDGTLVAQSLPGCMKSGSYNTAQSNSWIRVFLARMAGAGWAKAAGDDCVEAQVDGALQRYEQMGRIVKFYKPCPKDSFEFCSRVYYAGRTEPVNCVKGLFRLLSNRMQDPSLLDAFFVEYRESRELYWTLVVALLAGWGQQKIESQVDDGSQAEDAFEP